MDHIDDLTGSFAFAVTEHPEKGGARRSSIAFYKRNHWRTERCSNESPQRHGKCLAIPGTPRCEKNGRDSRVATFFHTFGSTVTLWYPLIEGVRIVTYPNPLDAAKCAELIDRYKLTFLLLTPTFLRLYLRKAEPKQLKTLRLIITGAEKLPLELASHFEERFHKRVFEGYGLTETAPVVSVNLPESRAAQARRTRAAVEPFGIGWQIGAWHRGRNP